MHKRTGTRTARSLLAAAAISAMAAAVTPAAGAGIKLDLRTSGINGTPWAGNPKHAAFTFGDTVNLKLFAVISGANGVNDETVQSVSGSLRSLGGLRGDYTGGVVAPFNGSGHQNGAQADIDSDGDLDLGAAINSTTISEYFLARSQVQTAGATVIDANTSEIEVGRFDFVATGGGSDFALQFFPLTSAGAFGNTTAVWGEDGASRSAGNGGQITVGAPITIPEPASAAGVALAAVGLLARRKRQG